MGIFLTFFCSAIDHVGLESEVSSGALTLDTSPPTLGVISIEGEDTGHITGVVRTNWRGFEDPESGVDFYQCCIGSSPKFADVISCLTTKAEFCTFSSDALRDGHVYFVTVKVSEC